jgi:hypothetical protein
MVMVNCTAPYRTRHSRAVMNLVHTRVDNALCKPIARLKESDLYPPEYRLKVSSGIASHENSKN